jgi:hypothetical protein
VTNENKVLFGNPPLLDGDPYVTQTLRGLEREGLARRTVYPEVPVRVESFLPILRLVGDVLSSIEACSIEPVTARITPDGVLPDRTLAAVVTVTTRRKVPGQGHELTNGTDAADEGRRPSPAVMAPEPLVWTAPAQPDELYLTCGNPKMILTTYKSDVHPTEPAHPQRRTSARIALETVSRGVGGTHRYRR